MLSGDRESFSQIVLLHQQNVYALALRMTADRQDALDISQEVFIKAYTSLGTFKGASRLSSWLYRITYNMCIDHLRRRAVLRSYSAGDEAADAPSPHMTPYDQVARQETAEEIAQAVNSLTEEQQQIFTMRQYLHMSYDEIARRLDISIGTVKSRLSRARRALADKLKKSGTFDDLGRHNDVKGESGK